ncbi:MAG: FISUMP domain-containing protein [Bacteroidota bacterium]
MKKNVQGLLLTFILFGGIFISSCGSKSKDPKPKEDPNSVTINGTVYPTVAIGSQIWTTINYKGPGGYSTPERIAYGSYFRRSEALKIQLPSGWRLPSIGDFNKLYSSFTHEKDSRGNYISISGKSATLCAVTGWKSNSGTNISGFNALPGGSCYNPFKEFESDLADQNAFFVTSDAIPESATDVAQYGAQISTTVAVITHRNDTEVYSLSVRFVKDE